MLRSFALRAGSARACTRAGACTQLASALEARRGGCSLLFWHRLRGGQRTLALAPATGIASRCSSSRAIPIVDQPAPARRSSLSDGVRKRIEAIVKRHGELTSAVDAEVDYGGARYISLRKEIAELEEVVVLQDALNNRMKELVDLQAMAADVKGDAELRSMAEEEANSCEGQISATEAALLQALIPKDDADEKSAIIEVRAGTGGDEAALFAQELFQMYQKYAALQGWRFEVMSESTTDLGGYREATASVRGPGVFGRLRFESGTHRVQRVPDTESQGRVHTSTVTVAVLPEAEEVDVKIDERDLRIDVFRSSGAGGQSVNKTESAVRVTHVPTGIVVAIQEDRSQHRNRARAMSILRSRLYEHQRTQLEAERRDARRLQIGTGDRSERIRTYNFPQGRVTDHRVAFTKHGLEAVLSGEALDEFIDRLATQRQTEELQALE